MGGGDERHRLAFAQLFRGRTDCYGAEWGSCIHRPLLPRVWRRHLSGDHPIGVYPHLPGDVCWWGAIDIDYVDDPAPAVAVREVWRWYGVDAHVERSRSKGWHVWVFLLRPVDCALVRSAGKAVAKMAGLDPKVEVYPKAATLPASSPGNYLRLPYPGGRWLDGHRAVWGHVGPCHFAGLTSPDGWWYEPDAFVEEAWRSRTDPALLGPLAALRDKTWGIGAKAAAEAVQVITEGVLGRLGASSQEVARVAFGGEAVPAGQRDNTFFTMAKFLAGSGVAQDMAEDIVTKVWNDQTDHSGHAFPLKVAMDKVRRAYQGREP